MDAPTRLTVLQLRDVNIPAPTVCDLTGVWRALSISNCDREVLHVHPLYLHLHPPKAYTYTPLNRA